MLRTEQHRASAVIVGLGQTGLSCARYFKKLGKEFRVVDSRLHPPGLDELQVLSSETEVLLGEISSATLKGAEELFVSPGVDLRLPALKQASNSGVKISGDIDIFSKVASAPILAVTGSNAKSTVVTLLGEMAAAAGLNVEVVGNIGSPVLDKVNSEEKSLYVVELSSFQLETTQNLQAEVATILNLSMDHMDRYDSMEDYLQAKQKIFKGCRNIVFNRDDSLTKPDSSYTGSLSSFGMDVPKESNFGCAEINGETWLMHGESPLIHAAELKIPGKHNIANALAALAVGKAAGLSEKAMIKALVDFKGLPHRCQWVAKIEGVDYFNDSKGTNTGACIAAIEGLADRGEIVLLVGGQSKGADLNVLRDVVESHVKHVVAYGEDAELFKTALKGVVSLSKAKTIKKAFKKAKENSDEGDVVLLSPACASFDLFNNYQERGEAFVKLVRGLQL